MSKKDLDSRLKKVGVETARKHLFLCLGPDCCSYKEGEEVWDFLKFAVKHLNIEVMRTKVGCFKICKEGPWLVVYPEGIWYGNVTVERLKRILREHVEDGHPITEWISARNDLGNGCAGSACAETEG